MRTWKLLVILGSLSLISGLAVVAVDAAYGWVGRTPGTIAMIGVSMMSAPWLTLAAYARHHMKVQQEKAARSIAEEPDIVRSLSQTGLHRSLSVFTEVHGEDAIRRALGDGMEKDGGKQ